MAHPLQLRCGMASHRDRVRAAAVPAEALEGEFPAISLPVRPPFPPMEARSASRLPTDAGWLFEPKWDGFRCLAFRQGQDGHPAIQARPTPGPLLSRARRGLPGTSLAGLRARWRNRHPAGGRGWISMPCCSASTRRRAASGSSPGRRRRRSGFRSIGGRPGKEGRKPHLGRAAGEAERNVRGTAGKRFREPLAPLRRTVRSRKSGCGTSKAAVSTGGGGETRGLSLSLRRPQRHGEGQADPHRRTAWSAVSAGRRKEVRWARSCSASTMRRGGSITWGFRPASPRRSAASSSPSSFP